MSDGYTGDGYTDREKIIELYNDMWTLPAIAQETHTSQRQIRRIVCAARESGEVWRPKGARGKLHPEHERVVENEKINERIAELYNSYHTQKEIAYIVGFSLATIRRRIGMMRERGLIERVGNRVFNADVQAQVLRYYDVCGWTIDRIADHLGISNTHIGRMVSIARSQGKIERPKFHVGRTLISEKTDKRIADLYNGFISIKEIGQELGFTKTAIKRRIKKMREEGRYITRPPRYDSRRQKAKDRYRRVLGYQREERMTAAEIAEREGIAVASVRRLLGIARKMFPAKGEQISERERRKRIVKSLRAEGMHKITIAKTMGLAVKTIEQYLRED